MTECLAEEKWENFAEKDDLVKLLQELQNRKGVLEKALSTWKERYSDIINLEEELEISSCYNPLVLESNWTMEDDAVATAENDELKKIPPKNLKRWKSNFVSAEKSTEEKAIKNDNFSRMYEQCSPAESSHENGEEDNLDSDEQYFEVSSATPENRNSDDCTNAFENILERLQETREKVTCRCGEFEGMIADISKEADESISLRERVGMTHRSLTMIEMRQEKAMREALYENVTANCTIRKLHEEVIQLRIRESQHQSDIQRLMAENSRLKMKLMEARFHGSALKTKAKKSASTSILPEEKCEEEFSDPIVPPSPPAPASAGLHDIDDLNRPVCVGAIHRGSLNLYKTKDEQGTICVSDDNLLSGSTNVRKRKSPCPLCSDIPDFSDFEDAEEKTRSIGTSTADIENIVAHSRTIVVMGMVIPIPLFLACLLRTIEESMLMIGRVCFAELPPCDPSFPELQEDVMKSLREMYTKVKQKIS